MAEISYPHMVDITNTGDMHGHVAALLHQYGEHHAHTHGHGEDTHEFTYTKLHPSKHAGHATYGDMVGGGSDRILNTLERILSNPQQGTPLQRQWAQAWIQRNFPDRVKASQQLSADAAVAL